jgi:hypothetical protein
MQITEKSLQYFEACSWFSIFKTWLKKVHVIPCTYLQICCIFQKKINFSLLFRTLCYFTKNYCDYRFIISIFEEWDNFLKKWTNYIFQSNSLVFASVFSEAMLLFFLDKNVHLPYIYDFFLSHTSNNQCQP